MAFIGRARHSVRAVVRESQGAGTGLPALPVHGERYLSCSAMLAPTQVLSMLKSTPIILPWLIRTRLLTNVGSCSFSGHTDIIRISALDFLPSTVGTNAA